MMHTIIIGSYIFVQGLFVRALPDGRAVVSVGDREFTGKSVSPKTA